MSVAKVALEERDADVRRTDYNFYHKMYCIAREIVFFMAITFTTYAALQNTPPTISKGPPPVPFFARNSLVTDFYSGQLASAFERVSESDVSFVMYYAPWDAESQAVRSHFSNVARFYRKQVFFAAINCWQPLSECRQQFSKVQQFPVLVAYLQHTKGIQYKGVKEASYMIAFLSYVLHPFQRVHGPRDALRLMAEYDALVIGYFDFSGVLAGRGFHAFYMAALKLLERDPYREVGFAVVTSQDVREQLGVYHSPAARLYLWNETLEFPHHESFTAEELTNWVSNSAHQMCAWVTPPGVKSLTLSSYVEDSSVLMLFTPRNLISTHNWMYKLLYEVGLQYYNCDGNSWISELVQYLGKDRIAGRMKYVEEEHRCSEQKRSQQQDDRPEVVSVQVSAETWTNDSCQSGERGHCKLCTACEHPVDSAPGVHEQDVCWEWAAHGAEHSTGPSHLQGLKTSMLLGEDDRSSQALLEGAQIEACRWRLRARSAHAPVFPRGRAPHRSVHNFTGLVCSTNRTLTFLAMDSRVFHQFAEALGVDILAWRDKTAALIFSAQEESTYLLEEAVNKGSLMEFVLNYTQGTLKRSIRSTVSEPVSALNRYPETIHQNCSVGGSMVCVPELTASSFLQTVFNPNKDVVVLYHTPYCAFCHGVSHIYLTVARYFRAVDKLLFTRIDGENNDLPWEYTMDHYPTILFFPARRKSESRVFPRKLPVTVPNLVNFVLANLGSGAEQLQGLVGLCAAWDSQLDAQSARACLVRARRDSQQLVVRTLAQLHAAKRSPGAWLQSRSLLPRLEHAKKLHLLLGSVDRLQEGSPKYARVQALFHAPQQAVVHDTRASQEV